MYNYQKIATTVIKRFTAGQNVTYSEIIEKVLSVYPKMKVGCILPSDLCNNYKNKDSKSGKHTIFRKELVKVGRYTVLSYKKIKESCNLK